MRLPIFLGITITGYTLLSLYPEQFYLGGPLLTIGGIVWGDKQ
jgi:hypothetical protein